ncbi:hypothetical protein JL722_14945 [Aureococcus anophagefferens]|nr:hypothetical protein JL722_14945 [Aureococcus anophagefferens]
MGAVAWALAAWLAASARGGDEPLLRGEAAQRGPLRIELHHPDLDFKHFTEPGWSDDGFFWPPDHDPRRFPHLNLTERRRRLEENKCQDPDGVCCSLCKNDLVYCSKLAGYLVEDTYYPSVASVTGSCDDIDKRAGLLDVFGPSKTFRDNEDCREIVREYVCLWWSTESSAYENNCKEKGAVLVPPCRSYCTQVSIQCANNLEYADLCKKIACPPTDEFCTPGRYDVGTGFACSVRRYNTPAKSGARPGRDRQRQRCSRRGGRVARRRAMTQRRRDVAPPRRLGALLVVVGLEAHSPTPAPTAGCLYGSSDWYGGSAGEDCTTVCGNVGLTCSTSELVARNDEVDSAAEVEALVASIYGETCASNVEATNIAPPYVKTNGDCAYKDPSGNFDCTQDGVGNKRRLCVCCVAAPTPRPTVSCQSGTVSFTTFVITTTANAARSVDTADVDGDGDLDPIVASFRDNMVAWYENDGSQSFAERIVATASASSAVARASTATATWTSRRRPSRTTRSRGTRTTGPSRSRRKSSRRSRTRVDGRRRRRHGDGGVDLLSASETENTIAWYENDGSASLTRRVITSTATNARSVFAAGVGGGDVLGTASAIDVVAWYENDGSQSFTGASTACGPCSYDIDGDGGVSVAVAVENDDTVAWYENDGSQSFTERALTTTAAGAAWVNAADLDSDGDVDLLSRRSPATPSPGANGCVANPSPTPRPTAATGASFAERVVSTLADEAYAVFAVDSFTERIITTAVNQPWSVYAIDVDGDGDVDPLAAYRGANVVAWYENDGSESFAQRRLGHANGARSVFPVDVDGDADVDLFSGDYSEDTVAWYENDGSQSFTGRVITTLADGIRTVFAIDVDGDGDVDALSASERDDTVAWYENDGSESFTERVLTTTADYAVSVFAIGVAAAAARTDGDVDVLAACKECDTGAWYENDGSQSFTKRVFSDADGPVAVYPTGVSGGGGSFTRRIVTTLADGACSVYAADIDGDGASRAVGVHRRRHRRVVRERRLRVLRRARHHGAGGQPRSVFAIDVDGDGDVDVLLASCVDDTVAWYGTSGSQSLTQRVISNSADFAISTFAMDVDGDGDVDVLSASYYDDTVAWHENDGSESFTEHIITTLADGAFCVFAIDLDSDGDVDVLEAARLDDTVAWHENSGSACNVYLFTSENVITTLADAAYSVFAIGVDGGGDVDALSASSNDDTVAWYENDGAQSFAKRAITNLANGAVRVFAIDVDGDGDVDALSTSLDDGVLAWFENDGSESFTQRIIASATSNYLWAVFAIDVDGDGDEDSFTKHTITTLADYAVSVYAIDVDGDGDVDALSGRVGVSSASYTADYAVFAIDVDGDGDVDLVSANTRWDEFAWFENDGSQSFTERVIAASADGAYSVFAIDVDGDGDVDAAGASLSDDTVAWYENDGSQSFTEHVLTTTADYATTAFAIDVDGDGDVDVVSSSVVDDTVAWFQGCERPPVTRAVAISFAGTHVSAVDVAGSNERAVVQTVSRAEPATVANPDATALNETVPNSHVTTVRHPATSTHRDADRRARPPVARPDPRPTTSMPSTTAPTARDQPAPAPVAIAAAAFDATGATVTVALSAATDRAGNGGASPAAASSRAPRGGDVRLPRRCDAPGLARRRVDDGARRRRRARRRRPAPSQRAPAGWGAVGGAAVAIAPSGPVAPAVLQAPEAVGSCGDLAVDASASSGGGGRALAYAWAVAGGSAAPRPGAGVVRATVSRGARRGRVRRGRRRDADREPDGGFEASASSALVVAVPGGETRRAPLVLAADSLTPGATYAFALSSVASSGASTSTTVNVVANGKPTSGDVSVAPASGVSLSTSFRVAAANWVDEDLP